MTVPAVEAVKSKFCDSKRSKNRGRCRRPAGWGTDHAGYGKCKLHGGATPIKHGRYATVPRGEIAEAMERQRAAEKPTEILDELALARGVLEVFVSKVTDGSLTGSVAQLTVELIGDVTRIAERIERMQHDRVRTISEATLTRVTTSMAEVVLSVLDRNLSSEVSAQLKREIHDGWGTIRD